MKSTVSVFLVVLLAVFLFGGNAFAIPTEINLSGSNGEPTLDKILDRLYGLDNLERISDSDDQYWVELNGGAYAEAKYASYKQNFGYIIETGDKSMTEYYSLFEVSDDGFLAGEPNAVFLEDDVQSEIRFFNHPSDAPLWDSLVSNNADGLDHMVTWLITGSDADHENKIGEYVIAWDDQEKGGDRDFNDLVVQIHSVAPKAVPEPGTILLLAAGLVGLAGIGRKKFFKK